jgi:hypothetical protein
LSGKERKKERAFDRFKSSVQISKHRGKDQVQEKEVQKFHEWFLLDVFKIMPKHKHQVSGSKYELKHL